MKQKTEDYKISAVKYYLKNNDNIRKTCKPIQNLLHLLTFQTPIYIWDFGESQNPQYKKGGLSVKSNRCLMTFKDTDPKGSAFEMSKGVKNHILNTCWIYNL